MIDKNSPIPVYFQLKNDIQDKISKGFWKVGESISSERELAENYEVSRMTIRQALGELVQEGILVRQKGKGTFVCEPRVKQRGMMSFSEMIKNTGRNLKNIVLGFSIIDTPEKFSDMIPFDKVYKINRNRMVDGECIANEIVYIPVDYCGYLDKKKLEGSLYKILDEFGYIVDHSEAEINAVLMDDNLKQVFNLNTEKPLLQITSKVIGQRGKVIFIEEAIYRSDKYALEVNISKREGKIR